MTNALRKAPQHTAVGFKQTVSGCVILQGMPLGVCMSGTCAGTMRSQAHGEEQSWVGSEVSHQLLVPSVLMKNLLP